MRIDRRAFTLIEILVVVLIICVFAAIFLSFNVQHSYSRRGAKRAKCQSNLMQLGIALTAYVDTHGGGRYYPYPMGAAGVQPDAARKGNGFSGAAFLAALYWSGVMTEPDIFICPGSDDDNHKGADLGTNPDADDGTNIPGWGEQFEQPDGSHVSYASRAQWSMPRGEPLLMMDLPPDAILAADDTDGEDNHINGRCVLHADGHVDFLKSKDD